jgi:hypothetical protein
MTKLADIAKRLNDRQDEVMKRPSALQKKREQTKEKKKVDTTEVSDKDDEYISIVEINTVTDMNNGWQYDTGASTHTTNLKHRFFCLFVIISYSAT